MVNLENLYKHQFELDKEIQSNHNVSYENTHEKRLLALIVELGELANETRCFKFWSNKGPNPKEIVMDEFADGLHFLLSLGIPLGTEKFEYNLEKQEKNLTEQFHDVYSLFINLKDNYNIENYVVAMQAFLNLAPSLGMNEKDIVNAYEAKLKVNYKRQETNY